MLTDTHCHLLSYYDDQSLQTLLPQIIDELRFVQDIGTKPLDFEARLKKLTGFSPAIPKAFRFSVGIWPAPEPIAEPEQSVTLLEKSIIAAREAGIRVALGECGLDRYWNGQNAGGHPKGQGSADIAGEELLFELQLRLAKQYGLSVIVHTRDAFEDTLKVIDRVGYHCGVIHCFAYGVAEAQAFLERGWYISFSGNCTFATTKVKKAATAELIKSIPLHKMLLETDAPYLAPAPHRGETNTPLLVRYVYEKVAEILDIPVDQLSDTVYETAVNLFG